MPQPHCLCLSPFSVSGTTFSGEVLEHSGCHWSHRPPCLWSHSPHVCGHSDVYSVLTGYLLLCSAFEGEPGDLDLADEVEFTLARKTNKVSAENIRKVPKGTVAQEVSVLLYITQEVKNGLTSLLFAL